MAFEGKRIRPMNFIFLCHEKRKLELQRATLMALMPEGFGISNKM